MKHNVWTDNGYLKALEGPFCTECGSDQVEVIADMYWDEYEQDWRLNEVDYDRTWCCECECNTDFDFKPMSRDKKIKYSVRRRQEENNGT
jgi:hypothetical protein